MILIHTALLCEAQSIIDKYRLKKTNSIPKIYSNNNIIILIGGVGKENTINSLKYIYTHYTIKSAINLGIAGSGDKKDAIGTLYCTNKSLATLEYKNLITSLSPVLTDKTSNSLYDMEGEYFLELSQKYLDSSNIFVFKVVSDHLNISNIPKDQVKKLIADNLSTLAEYIK